MTQLVQEYTIRAQVRAMCKKRGIKIDRTEHVANSLGHLAAVVDQLNSLDHPLKVGLSRVKHQLLTVLHGCMQVAVPLIANGFVSFFSWTLCRAPCHLLKQVVCKVYVFNLNWLLIIPHSWISHGKASLMVSVSIA